MLRTTISIKIVEDGKLHSSRSYKKVEASFNHWHNI